MSTNKPSVSIGFTSNNLLQALPAIDGVAAFIGTGFLNANLNKVFIVNNLQEAEQQGITAVDEPAAHRQLKEFYTELAASQEVYLLLLPATVTMAQMLDSTAIDKAEKLLKTGAGKIATLGVFKQPLPNYIAGNDFIDTDCVAALNAAKTFCQLQNIKLRFIRVLIEARVNNEASTNIFEPNTTNNGFANLVIGGSKNDKSASVGVALARRHKYAAHIKLGKTENGALSLNNVFVGTKSLNEDSQLVIPAVNEVLGTATITCTNKGADGDFVFVYHQKENGWIFLGACNKEVADTTEAALALKLRNAINANTANTGYTATSSAGVLTVVAPVGSGSSVNTTTLYVGFNGSMNFTNTAFTGGVTAKPQSLFSTDNLHNKGYITFTTYPGEAGYYFGIDNMASKDDFKLLSRGAVADACAKIAATVFVRQLESEVDTNSDGSLSDANAAYIDALIEQTVKQNMGERITNFFANIVPNNNLIANSKMGLKLRIQPKGYLTFIDLEIGFTPTAVN
jgi:hypothetical protein